MADHTSPDEVEWLAAKLAASEVRYERGLGTLLLQLLEISPELRHDFARTHFSDADLNWFQGGANAVDALAGEGERGERINLGAEDWRAHAVIRSILDYARSAG